ncbi:MAG: DUF192 domain-containing protein [Actinomycetota bacterium]
MAWLVSEARVLAAAEVAPDRRSRRKGLLGRDGIDGAFVIEPCRWVHTLGMRFDLDVAHLDADGRVLRTATLARHRIGRPVPRAAKVIEAERGAFQRWGLRVGDVVEIRPAES